MLPRWLTVLPRFVATWRDEILVVTLGFAYQAGVSGSLGAARHHEDEQVVVRIAAEAPRPVVVTTDTRFMTEKVTARALAAAVRVAPAPRVHVKTPVRVVAPVRGVLPARVQQLRVPVTVVTPDAGENVAADMMAGLDVTAVVVDTFTRAEIRASIERARAAMNEARVRAAVQKALAAERALPRAFQGPGA
jgi:hypothetical protein